MSVLSDGELRERLIADADAGWRAFVDQYSPRLLQLIEQCGVRDRDDAMDLYVHVCERLAADDCARLRRYDSAKGALAAWLTTVVRRMLVDWVRSTRGRKRLFGSIKALSAIDQDVFERYYWRRHSPAEMADLILGPTGRGIGLAAVFASLERIERALTERQRADLLAMAARLEPGSTLDGDDGEPMAHVASDWADPEMALLAGRRRDSLAVAMRTPAGRGPGDSVDAYRGRIDVERDQARAAPRRSDRRPPGRHPVVLESGPRIATRDTGMTHLSPGELQAWYELGRADDRDRVIRHLADCDTCRRALSALAMGDVPLVTEPPSVATTEAVPLGYAARKPAASTPSWAGWLRPAYGLAAAAVIVAAIVVVTRSPGPGPDDAVRSAELLAIAPSGAVAGLQFKWESPFEAASYHVTVRDATAVLIFEMTTRGSQIEPDPSLRGRVIGGQSYTWQVAALDRDGAVIATSRPVTFVYQR
jgi:DNA-directed RNA polymerase specialized sigma24 family protein